MATSVSGAGNEVRIDIKRLLQECKPSEPHKGKGESVTVTCANMTTITQAPNTPIEIYYPDEDKTLYVDPQSGEVLKITTEEFTLTPQPDGTTIKEYVDGRTAIINEEEGTTKTFSADRKTVTTVDKKKCAITSEITQPDGSKAQKYADKTTSYIIIPGFLPTTYYANGSVKFGKDAPPSFIDRKQSTTEGRETRTPYGDGNYFVEVKNKKGEATETRIELYDHRTGEVTVEKFLAPETCAAK